MKKTSLFIILAAFILFNHSGSSAQDRIEKKREIATKSRMIDERGGDLLGYSGEILAMLENSCGIKCRPAADDFFEEIDRSDVQSQFIDTFSIFSGGLSLRHSLQLETVKPRDEKSGTVDPASLSSPVMKQISYSAMLKGKTYRIYNIDHYAPADFYYLHFSDAGKVSDVISYIEETAAAVRRRISAVSIDYMTREKIVTQLALKEGDDLGKFYSSVIDELVITGSDPFIIEGSDVTLIIRPKNRELLESRISDFRKEYKSRYGCEEKEVTASGVSGTLLCSQGRRVHSYLFTLLDGTILISNSLKASETVIDTANGRHPALADAADYLYTRSIFPAQGTMEDGFLYISDLFVKHLSSPVLKIVESRRMKELMRMAVLEKYAIYYYMLNGKRSASVEEIVSAPGTTSLNESRKKELAAIKRNPSYERAVKLDREQTSDWSRFESTLSSPPAKKSKKGKRRDTGAATLANAMKVFYRNMTGSSAKSPQEVLNLIELAGKPGGFNIRRFDGLRIIEGRYTAISDIYGRSGYMTPCIDIDPGMATDAEAADYRDFARDYGSTGEAYISPTGIRFRPDGAASAEAFVFRTGDNPFYSLISAFAGGASVPLHPDSTVKGDVLSVAVKLDPLALNRYFMLNGIKVRRENGKEIGMSEILSGEVQVHMGDSLPPAGFNSSALRLIMNGEGYGYSDAVSGLMVWSLLHPVRLTIPVKESRLAETAVESIRMQIADKLNSGNLMKCDSFSFEYCGAEVKVLRMTMLGSLTARVYSTVKNGTLHIATTERYIRSVLEPVQQQGKIRTLNGNAAAVIRPAELTQEREMYRSGLIEEAMLKSMKNFGMIKLMSLIYPDAQVRELPDLAYRDFGFRPVCPLGGEYLVEKSSGEVYSSAFGGYNSPVIRSGVKELGPVYDGLRRFFSTAEIRAELSFTPEGMKLKLSSR